jgi:hypothetical protein
MLLERHQIHFERAERRTRKQPRRTDTLRYPHVHQKLLPQSVCRDSEIETAFLRVEVEEAGPDLRTLDEALEVPEEVLLLDFLFLFLFLERDRDRILGRCARR